MISEMMTGGEFARELSEYLLGRGVPPAQLEARVIPAMKRAGLGRKQMFHREDLHVAMAIAKSELPYPQFEFETTVEAEDRRVREKLGELFDLAVNAMPELWPELERIRRERGF